jgi:hypothetical protein
MVSIIKVNSIQIQKIEAETYIPIQDDSPPNTALHANALRQHIEANCKNLKHSKTLNMSPETNYFPPIAATPRPMLLPRTSSLPLSTYTVTNFPASRLTPNFIGRQPQLEILEQFFGQVHRGPAPKRCLLSGVSGVGKTQIALRYISIALEKKTYNNIFWVPSSTLIKLSEGLSQILTTIGHRKRSDPSRENLVETAISWLESEESGKWLVVFDNVTMEVASFLEELLPQRNGAGGNILFTAPPLYQTSKPLLSLANDPSHLALHVETPDLADATTLLLTEAGQNAGALAGDAITAVRDIATDMGCLPAALVQAGSLIKLMSIHQTLFMYKNNPVKVCLGASYIYFGDITDTFHSLSNCTTA